jgi:hypothetical protein
MILFLVLMFATPTILSATLFTSPDRDRARAAADTMPRGLPVPVASPLSNGRATMPPESTTPPLRSRAGLKALVWLSARQLLRPGLFLSAFALVFGLGILLPSLQPILIWPALALAAGVFGGVTMMADEQTSGAARYWGERRLPLGRAWAVKVAIHLALVIWLLFLLILPSSVPSQETAGHPLRISSLMSFGPDCLRRANLARRDGNSSWSPQRTGLQQANCAASCFGRLL